MSLECAPFPGPLEVIGTTAGLAGGTPDLDVDTISVQLGTTVQNVTSPFGTTWIVVTLPTPFPNGLLTVTCSIGDASNRPTQPPYVMSGTVADFIVALPGSAVGFPVRVNWTAWGW